MRQRGNQWRNYRLSYATGGGGGNLLPSLSVFSTNFLLTREFRFKPLFEFHRWNNTNVVVERVVDGGLPAAVWSAVCVGWGWFGLGLVWAGVGVSWGWCELGFV